MIELRWRGRGGISLLGSALVRAAADQLHVETERDGDYVVVRGNWPAEAWIGTEAISAQVRRDGFAVRPTGLATALVALAGGCAQGDGVWMFPGHKVELDLQVGVLFLTAGECDGVWPGHRVREWRRGLTRW